MGVSQEPGRPCRLRLRVPEWGTGGTNLQARGEALLDVGSKRTARRWYRQAKETKCGGKGGRESEHLDSTGEAGELDPRDPVEGRGMPGHGTVGGRHDGDTEFRDRLNETAADSGTGAGSAGDGVHHAWPTTSTWTLLLEAYQRTRKDGAAGVDGQTAEEYAANLEENLQSLLDRFKSGRTGRRRCGGCTFPKGTAPRRGRSGSRPLRTRCFSGRWRWCWRPSTSRTF